MLKIKVTDEGNTKIKFEGKPDVVIANMMVAVHKFYNKIPDEWKEDCKNSFKKNIDTIFEDTDEVIRIIEEHEAEEELKSHDVIEIEVEYLELISQVLGDLKEAIDEYKHQRD